LVKWADLEPSLAQQGLKQAESELASAQTPEAKLKAQIEMETFYSLVLELGASK